MSRGRPLFAIYREMARIHNEQAGLYNELAGRVEDDERTIPVVATTTTKPERKPSVIVRPEGESNDLDRARARRVMRAEGWTENDQ